MALALALPGSANETVLSEVTKLIASDAQTGDQFGWSVAISGDTAVLGAYAKAGFSGAAYVFEWNQSGPGNWSEVTRLTASDAQADDQFGISVAISGDTAILGAYLEDAGGNSAGATYIFQRNQGGSNNWGEVTKLTASDAQAGDGFGGVVAISGSTAIVGAVREDTGGVDAGAVYIFERDEGGTNNWGEVTKLTASDAQANDGFGASVAISGDAAIVGARWEDAGGSSAGAAYVFERNQGGPDNWGQVTKLIASDAAANDQLGWGSAVSGETAIVGAYLEDARGNNAGAAYIFQRNQGGPNNWGEVRKLTASDAQDSDHFGLRVAMGGDTAIVGARNEDTGGGDAGAVYVFERDEGGPDNWGEVQKLVASDAEAGVSFGVSVAISGNAAVVGAYFDNAAGIDAGAAYVFGLQAVGGIAELAEVAAAPVETTASSGSSASVLAGVAALAIATVALAFSRAAWYIRQRLRLR